MKSILSLMIAASFATSAFALDVRRQDVADANAPARELTLTERLTLRVKLNWARLALIELNHNERVFNLVGANDSKARRVLVGFADTAVLSSLVGVTAVLAQREVEIEKIGQRDLKGMGYAKHRKQLVSLDKELNALDQSIVDGVLFSTTGASRGALAKDLAHERLQQPYFANLKHNRGVSPIQRTARGFKMALGAGLVFVVVQDVARTWIQISMSPEQVQQKKAGLEAQIQDLEQQLADNATVQE